MKPLFITAIILFLHTACGSSTNKPSATAVQPTDTLTTLRLPEIPVMLNTPEQRASYLAEHYWEHINWADTNYIHHPEISEQGWANFIDILKLIPTTERENALKNTFAAAEVEKKCYQYLIQLADKYLYDPNSPLRNEEYYITVLDAIIHSSILTTTEKIRYQERRVLAQRNRIGTPAQNFSYTLISGTSGQLYDIQANYTLVFFNNPGCHTCGEVMDALKTSQVIRNAIRHKQLKVLSLYPDEDIREWKAFANSYPREWINGYDKKQVIQEKNLYDLKAIPSLYLLDKSKKVLLKDTTTEEIERWLSQ